MESFLLLGLAGLVIWLSNSLRDLKDRLKNTERGLADLRVQLSMRQRGPTAPQPPRAATEVAPQIPATSTTATPITPETATPGVPRVPVQPASARIPQIEGAMSPAPGRASPEHASPSRLEEQLGTRWAVWVGAVALALGGLLLVRYSIEAGLIGPAVRIALGALLAAVLAGTGEWMRRTDLKVQVPVLPAADIPSALTSAATVVALGTAYAAHALYGFIGPGPAFVLLGAIALGALAASALHGPWLAGVGLLGAFAVPALVSSSEPSPWPVVVYLGIVGAAAYALARLRRWLWLAGGAVIGAVLWALLLASGDVQSIQGLMTATMVHVLVQLALASFFMGIEPHAGTADADAVPDWIGHAALAALSAAALILVMGEAEWPARPVAFVLIAIGILALTALSAAPVAAALLLGGGLALGVLVAWPGLKMVPPPLPGSMLGAGGLMRLPANVESYVTFAVLVPLTVGLFAGWRLLRGSKLPSATAALLAGAATLPPLLALVVAYLRVTQFDHSVRFALAAAVLAAIFAAAAETFARSEARDRTVAIRLGTGVFAAAAIAALSLALTCGLERGYLTVAFALSALGAAYVSAQRDVPLLRYAVLVLGGVVLVRVGMNPRIMGADVGKWPVFNWLLLGYGVPAVAFAWSARFLRARGDDLAVRLSDALGVVFAALLVGYQIRHLLYAGDVLHTGSSHVEMGLQTTASLGLSYALTRLDLARSNIVFRYASIGLGLFAAAVAFFGLALAENPLLREATLAGRPWLSSLSIAYLLPGAMAVLAARAARPVRPNWYTNVIAALAALLLLGFVTLEVRHMFQGPVIHWTRGLGGAEQWAYSVAWLLLGLAFLAYGVMFTSKPARLASAALVLLSVLKVFLLDLSGLSGLWRALSFISLGVVLIGIGLVYQRLLFQRPAQPQTPAPGDR